MKRLSRFCLAVTIALSTVAFAPLPAATAATTDYTPPAGLKIAIVRSDTTVNWNAQRGSSYNHGGRESRLRDYLRAAGYDVREIVGDRDLQNLALLQEYDVVVLPFVFGMNRAASVTLLKYVAGGGGVVSALASPRVSPELAQPAGQPNDQREWWATVMNYKGWEWGPMSEAYQAYFIDDNFTPKFRVKPKTAHPVTAKAQDILEARGFDVSAAEMTLLRDPGSGLELVVPLTGNSNTSRIADFQVLDSTVTRRYPATYPAALSAKYRLGRSVYFYFSPMDFLSTYNTALYNKQDTANIPQGEIAMAYLEGAIQWAAESDGTTGPIRRVARTYATVDAYQSGIYWHQYVSNAGNVSTHGTLSVRVYNPSGKLVKSWTRYRHGIAPGHVQRWSNSYRPGTRLAAGKYRVVLKHTYGYPSTSITCVEDAYVVRGQGTGIKSRPVGTSLPVVSGVTVSPSTMSPNGDGVGDVSYLQYKSDKWAIVDVKVYNSAGVLVAKPVVGHSVAPGITYTRRVPGTTYTGRTLSDGTYKIRVYARNSKGSAYRQVYMKVDK